MKIYDYEPLTGEFIGERDAQESPLEPETYLIPASSTPVPPPPIEERQAAVWNSGTWVVKEDLRGTRFWTESEGLQVQETLGPIPPFVTIITEEDPELFQRTDGTWTDNPSIAEQAEGLTLSRTAFLVDLHLALVAKNKIALGDDEVAYIVSAIDDAVVAGEIPAATAVGARILIRNAGVFYRSDPQRPGLLEAVGSLPAISMTSTEIDQLFIGAAGKKENAS